MTIKIPSTSKRHSVPNNSDLFGTLHYTKNINLDEEGYIKLSNRTVQLQTEKSDANMELPLAFGRTASAATISFNMVTSEDPFTVSIGETAISVTENGSGSNPDYTLDSHGKWFHNLWISTDTNGFYSLAADGTTWDADDTSTLTSAKAHPIEVFRNKDEICFGNGNTVKMYSESSGTYTLTATLTLPTDYEVIGLAYSNYKMGVLTQLSDTITGQNQDAYFFVWDGVDTEADQGIETGTDRCLGIVAYKGTWAILTRTGQLRYFTGGGWQELAQLPFYFKDLIFGTADNRDLFGDILLVEGDIIYINYSGLLTKYGTRYETYLANNVGGILVYDPKIGLYQRYSHSISPVSMLTVTSGNIDTATNILTKTAGTIPSTGSPIKYTASKTTQIGGLTTPTIYYCIKLSSTTFSLAETRELALAGVAINVTSTGDTNNYFLALEVYDYGVTKASRIGGMALVGTNNGICDSLIFGSELQDFDSAEEYHTLNLVVTGFDNRGYVVTPKITSNGIFDIQKKLYVKYRPLKTNDQIIVKKKTKDILGLPVSTPQRRADTVNQCVWTGNNSFYTTANLAAAQTAFDDNVELECEIIAGAGAGVLMKISNLSYDSGTGRYVVSFAEDVQGAGAGRYCDVLIENWELVGSITSADVDGFKEFPIGSNSVFLKFKVELRGVETTIEEFTVVNETNKNNE